MLKLTPKERVLFVRRLTPALLVLLGVFSLVFINFIRTTGVAEAATGSTVNFQARLQSATGAIAPDGNYNVEFKLYSGSSCTPSTGTGCTVVWTEGYLNSNGQGLKTVNGYLSANLGSITAFSGINWDQQLWMSMNIGGTSTGTPTWDGAMKPYLSLTAVPYAFSAGQLNTTSGANRSSLNLQAPTGGDQNFVIQDQGVAGTYNLLTQNQSDSRYIQLQSSTPGTQQTGNINISGTVAASTVQVSSVDTAAAGTLSFGNTNATTINIGSNGLSHTINIGTSSGGTSYDQFITIGNGGGASTTTVQGADLILAGNNVNMYSGNQFVIRDSFNNQLFVIDSPGTPQTTIKTNLQVNGSQVTTGGGQFGQAVSIGDGGLSIAGYTGNTYTTPSGVVLQSAINIQNHDLAAFGSVLGLGVTANSAASARGILVADDRTGNHQPTIGVLSSGEDDILGFSYDGGSTGLIKTLSGDIGIAPAGSTAATFTATSVTLSKDTTVNANITVSGNVAYKHGTDFATTGTSNDVSFGSGTLFRLTGASSQTITGIASGTDGRQLTLMNTASQAATLANNSASSVAANRIITGTGSDLTIAAGASVSLVYDSSASLWHVVGTISGSQSGGSYVSLQATTPATADTGNLNISGQGTFGTGLTVRTSTNNSSALTIQDTTGVGVFAVDTTYKVVNIGGVAGSGTTLVNSGATVNLTLALGNFASGGSIGTAATTVDAYTSISVAQTTSGQTLSLPTPSNATEYGHMLYISNVGSVSFMISGTPLSAGSSASFIWSNTSGGAKWQYAGADGNSILNQSSSTQTANFNISGTGVAANLQATSGIATPLLDTGSATTLNIGTTNATSISLNKATLVNVTSTSAFKIQDASANVLLTADTSTGTITFGTATNGVVFTAGGGLVANGTARHGKKISLTPEYAGAVLDNTNDTGGANCATNSNGTLTTGYSTGLTGFGNTTQNYYQWLSSQASAQCYDLVVQVPIPADFSAWSSTTPIAINTYSSNTTNGTIALQAIAGNGTTESNCNYVGTTPASASTWTASGGSCTLAGSYSAGDTMTLRIRVTSSNSANVRVGNISLSYKSSF